MPSAFHSNIFTLLFSLLFQCGLYAQTIDPGPEFSIEDGVNTESSVSLNKPSEDYSRVDTYSLQLKNRYKKIPDLAKDLVSPFNNDLDKVRSIFIWITNNIGYNCSEFHSKKSQRVSFSYRTAAELADKRQKFYFEYATKVLRSKKGICEGYAVLFQELCLANNIPCEVVIGTASINTAKISRIRGKKNFSTNHAWVRVKIDNVWYYADPTWAAGYCDKPVKHFYKEFNPDYFLVPVDRIYPTHALNEKETEKRNTLIVKNH